MNPILFMDIDGVLNRHNAKSKYDDLALLPEKITLVNQVLQATDCYVVIISNWAQDLDLERIVKMLYDKGFLIEYIIDSIKSSEIKMGSVLVMGIEKDKFIRDYIITNKVDNFAVLDDNLATSIVDNDKIVSPYSFEGITEKEVDQLIKILNG